MTLVCANALSIIAERESAFVVGGYNLIELRAADRHKMRCARGKQCVHSDPSSLIELQANPLRFMPQNEA
jgi:hypothetical protein